MTRTELDNAADSLRTAADLAHGNQSTERLREQSAQFEELTEADTGPDHGKLARHEHILSEIADEEVEAADHIESALESIRAYRETLEGV